MVDKMSNVSSMKKTAAPMKSVSMKKPMMNNQKSVSPMVVGEKKSMWWLWVIIAVVVIGALAITWWLV